MMKSADIIRKLEAEGWRLKRIKGDHHIFGKDGRGITVVTHPRKDVPLGTIKAIEKQTGVQLLPEG
jgi:predicted RNA binding protein YcfA (HicA-like mRNA interferase family)